MYHCFPSQLCLVLFISFLFFLDKDEDSDNGGSKDDHDNQSCQQHAWSEHICKYMSYIIYKRNVQSKMKNIEQS